MRILKSLIVLLLPVMFAACGDDNSDFISRPDGKEPSSSAGVFSGSTRNLTDSRDGKTYKILTIGTQTWMAENLNFETDSSFCYNDEETNCTKFDRLYMWEAAITACPGGWHLPNLTEWETLMNSVGGQTMTGKALMSTSGWDSDGNGTDSYGFSVLPAGYRDFKGNYKDEGSNAFVWTSTEVYSDSAYYVSFWRGRVNVNLGDRYKYDGLSVRCLKD